MIVTSFNAGLQQWVKLSTILAASRKTASKVYFISM